MINMSIFLECVFSSLHHLKGQTVPNRIFGLFVFFFPHGTSWHRAKSPDILLYRSSTDFSLSLYATLWHRAEVPDILPNRSPTDFSFLTPPHGTFRILEASSA